MNAIVSELIDEQIRYLHRCRAFFPFLASSVVGKTGFYSPPYYQAQGFDVAFEFARPLTEDDVSAINALGYWINQNFIVRLHAVMDSNGLVGTIEQGRDGWKAVDLVRRLRHCFAHGSGLVDPSKQRSLRLYQELLQEFALDESEFPLADRRFPLAIDRVLVPLAEECKKYAGRCAQ